MVKILVKQGADINTQSQVSLPGRWVCPFRCELRLTVSPAACLRAEWLHPSLHGRPGESPGCGEIPPGDRRQPEHCHGSEKNRRPRSGTSLSCFFFFLLTHTFLSPTADRMASPLWPLPFSRATTRWFQSCWRTIPKAKSACPPCISRPAKTTPNRQPCFSRTTTMPMSSPRYVRGIVWGDLFHHQVHATAILKLTELKSHEHSYFPPSCLLLQMMVNRTTEVYGVWGRVFWDCLMALLFLFCHIPQHRMKFSASFWFAVHHCCSWQPRLHGHARLLSVFCFLISFPGGI